MTTAGQPERPATNVISEAVAKPDINTTNRTGEAVSAATMTGMGTGPEFFEYAAVTPPASESRPESRLESRLESAAYLEIIPGGEGRRGSGGRVGESDGEGDGEELTANQQRILELLSQNPRIAAPELAEVVGITKRNIEHNVAALKKMGRLKRIGPARGRHWEALK